MPLARLVVLHKNTSRLLHLGSLTLPCPSVMGILNVTPDSFSDGGRFVDNDVARRQAESMLAAGASIIDIGGESTRPGADDVSEQQELDRVLPIIEMLRATTDLPISIDTSKAAVMRDAVAAGASMINDVVALQGADSLSTVAQLGVPVCLMHMQGQPRMMQDDPQYADVAQDIVQFLRERVNAAEAAGIRRDHIIVDPGFGFGKNHAHNVELLANLRQLRDLGLPVLVGLSRKSTLGEITDTEVDARMPASVAAATIAVMNGAQIIRAHDVKETVDAVKVAHAVMEAGK
jgi:dihydropteroate synthase